MTQWKLPCKEILISIDEDGSVSLIPVGMDGTTHHSTAPTEHCDYILVYYGAMTSYLVDGNICLRGNRLIVDVNIMIGRLKCLVAKIRDTSGEEP